jgi:hypothetical protein
MPGFPAPALFSHPEIALDCSRLSMNAYDLYQQFCGPHDYKVGAATGETDQDKDPIIGSGGKEASCKSTYPVARMPPDLNEDYRNNRLSVCAQIGLS